jgi:hypothetical protein
MLARKFPPPNTATSTPHCLLRYWVSSIEPADNIQVELSWQQRNSNNSHEVIGLRYVRKRTV